MLTEARFKRIKRKKDDRRVKGRESQTPGVFVLSCKGLFTVNYICNLLTIWQLHDSYYANCLIMTSNMPHLFYGKNIYTITILGRFSVR